MSKNLIVWSLLLTTSRGSTLLSFDRVRFVDVRDTELLIDPGSMVNLFSHCFLPNPRAGRRGAPELL